MSELLPSLAATSIREGLLDYLETTFSLADLPARAALNEFLEHPSDGIFKDEIRIAAESETRWVARVGASGSEQSIWFVARDDRGGVTWEERRVRVRVR